MTVKSCIVIEDEPLAIKQITQCILKYGLLDLKCIISDMETFKDSISLFEPDIIFLDYFIPGTFSFHDLFQLLPEKSYIVITSAIPLIAHPVLEKHFSVREYIELNKPFSTDKFEQCIDAVIANLPFKY